MEDCSTNRYKTSWEKKKLLVTSDFSFSDSVLKRFVLQRGKSQGLFGKGLNILYTSISGYFLYDFLDLLVRGKILISWEVTLHHLAVSRSATMYLYYLHFTHIYAELQIYRICHELTVEIKFY